MPPADDLEAARHVEALPISKPRKTYEAVRNRSESASAIPLRPMESEGIRKRLSQLHSSRSADEIAGSSTSTGIELTPASSEDSEQAQEESPPVFWLTAKLQQICGAMKSWVFSRSNEDDIESPDHKYGYDKIKIEEDPVNGYPQGFPRLAALLSADNDMMMFRGFRRTHSRLLLQLQVEITQLENALDKLDKEDDADEYMWHRLQNTEHNEDWDQRQKKLLNSIQTKLKEYDTILLDNAQIQRLGRPPTRNHRSLYTWVYTQKELDPAEYEDFIRHQSDFVSGVGSTESGRRSDSSNFIEELIRSHFTKYRNSPITWFVRIGKETTKPGDPPIDKYSPFKLAILYRIIIVSLAAGILLVPVFLLFLVSMTRVQMALVVLAFVLLFGGVMCTTTDATTQEILVAIAAYGAVLVTFLGNFSGNQSCGPMNNTG